MTRHSWYQVAQEQLTCGALVRGLATKCQDSGYQAVTDTCIPTSGSVLVYIRIMDYRAHKMRRRKPEPTLLLTQGIFDIPYHIGII